jgi:hypothetical protein
MAYHIAVTNLDPTDIKNPSFELECDNVEFAIEANMTVNYSEDGRQVAHLGHNGQERFTVKGSTGCTYSSFQKETHVYPATCDIATRIVARCERLIAKNAFIEKTPEGYCVRSETNPDWSGGCYPTRAAAEERLRQVEMFSHL